MPTLFARARRHQRRQERWIETNGLGPARAHDLERLNPASARRVWIGLGRLSRRERDLDRLSRQFAATGDQRDDVSIPREFTGLLCGGPVGVAQIVESNDQILL